MTTEVHEQRFLTTVYLLKKPFDNKPNILQFEHTGPAEYKLDAKYNLRVEVYYPNSDFETVLALVLADTFYAVSQELIVEDDEIDEDCPCEDCGDGETPKLDALMNDEDNVFTDDVEVQVHDPNAQEW